MMKVLNKIWCRLKGHPGETAPIIELWESTGFFSGGVHRITVFKCSRCNSTLGSTYHE